MLDRFNNIVYDTNFVPFVPQGGFVHIDKEKLYIEKKNETKKKSGISFFDAIINWFIPPKKTEAASKTDKKKDDFFLQEVDKDLEKKDLKEQLKYFLSLPDEEYSDKKLTSKLRQYILEVEKRQTSLVADYKTHIAPSYREVQGRQCNISGALARTRYVQDYPSYIEPLRIRDIFALPGKRDMSFFLYKEDSSGIQSVLRTKSTQIKAELREAARKGITIDTELELKYRDIETIRQKLATHEESYFETGCYITMYNEKEDKLTEDGKKLEQAFSGLGIRVKQAIQRMDEGFTSTLPLCQDELGITRSTITTSMAGSFPFLSGDIFMPTGILYGINMHTGGLVVFDRYGGILPNMNSVVLATSGAGKSFTVKLEIIRYLINGVSIVVIDPENEYKDLCEKLGGTYINVSTSSGQHINPFDLPPKVIDREYTKGDLLRSKIMDLIGLFHILLGGLDALEESLLDKALQTTYQLKGITFDDEDYSGKEIPLLMDLANVLDGMEGAESLSLKLSKYVTGSFAKIFNAPTNVDIHNNLTVFSIRDLEDVLKTPAMYSVLNFIWTLVRAQKKKRMLVCDEAWILLQHDVSANFLFGLIKRARKYGLGITTISQDIEDFMRSKYGKPIISNSPFQILLKQSPSSIKALEELLGLSEAEKHRLVSAGIGEGLIFAGNQHAAVKIIASSQEKEFITTGIV